MFLNIKGRSKLNNIATMNINRICFYILCFLLTISCVTQYDSNDIVKKINVFVGDTNKVIYSDLFESVTLIPLESSDNSLLRGIRRIKVDSTYIFILSGSKIKIFNKQGHFIAGINKKGKGPGEYLRIDDFIVHSDKKIIDVFDSKQMKILQYDYQGNYKGKFEIGLHGFTFISLKNNPNDYFFYTGNIGYNSNSNSKLNLYSIEKGRITKKYFEISKQLTKYLFFYDENNFTYIGKDTIRFMFIPSDTIYSIVNNNVTPAYVIEFENNKLPPGFLDKNYRDIVDFIETLNKKPYASIITGYLENSKYIFLQFMFKGVIYHVYYNKKTSKTTVCNNIVDDVCFHRTTSYIPEFYNRPYAFTESTFYYILEPYKLIERMKDIKGQLGEEKWEEYKLKHSGITKIYENASILNNPILAVYRIK